MKSIKLAVALCLLLPSVTTFAQEVSTVNLLGESFYVYTAEKGKTLFAVARENNWDDIMLQSLNPDAPSPLRKGYKLFYPAASTVQKKDSSTVEFEKRDEFVHTIQSGDTFSSIASEYNISIGAIMRLNPGVTPYNFREGQKILIPAAGQGLDIISVSTSLPQIKYFKTEILSGSDTWTSFARQHDIDSSLLREANPDLKTLKKNSIVSIPVVEEVEISETAINYDPREQSQEGIKQIYAEVHKLSDKLSGTSLKIATIVESPSARKDMEFVRGFLVGLNSQKNAKVDFNVVDGTLTQDKIISKLEELDPNLIFITFDKNIPEYLLDFAEKARTPVISTFDVKGEEHLSNPYFVQLMSPSNSFNESVASNAADRFKGYTLVLVGENDTNDLLAASLRNIWEPYSTINLDSDLSEDWILPSLGKYVFYCYSTRKEEVESFLKKVAAFKSDNLENEVSVLGRPNWIVYDETLSEWLRKANTVIPSRFFIDRESSLYKNFISDYKDLFEREPVNSVPLYAGVGFDTASYFIPGLINSSFDINALKASKATLQSQFDLHRINNWSGLVNFPVYMIQYYPSGMVDYIVIE